MSISEPVWKTIFFVVTGIVALVADIVAILSAFEIPHISVANVTIQIPNISFSFGVISDVHVAFALIIYASVALTWVANKISERLLVPTIALLPATLFALWSATYFWRIWWVVTLCLTISNLWMAYFTKLESQISNSSARGILLILMFPTNALFLIGFEAVSPFWAWLTAVGIAIIQLRVMSSDQG